MKITLSTLNWQFVSCKLIWIIKFVLYVSCYFCIIRLVPRVILCWLTSLLNEDIMLDRLSVFHYKTQFTFVVVEMGVSYYDPKLLVLPPLPGSSHFSLHRDMLERLQRFSCKI